MDYKDLANKVRTKYPGVYDDFDDTSLAQKIVQKYPEYSDTTFDDKPEKGIIRRTAESIIDSPALPVAGGIIGGIAGSPTGPGSIATAGLGGAGGEAIRQLAARALDMKSPETSLEAAKDIGVEGATQAIGEGVGKFVVSPLLKGTGKLLKKPAEDLFQIITKMKPEDAATLFKNPKAIFPAQMEKASKAWRAAAEKIGIPVDDISPDMIEILKGDGKAKVFDTYAKIIAEEPVTAKEAQIAKQALDSVVMPVAKTVRKNPQVATLNKIRESFVERLNQESPEMAKANKEYAIASAGKNFRSLFPRNTTGTPAYFRSTILPSFLLGTGIGRGEPGEGLLMGATAGLASSPLAIGSLIALAGGANGLTPFVRRGVVASLAELANQKLKGK